MVKLEWLVAACGLAIVLALAIQVTLARPEGFVVRTSWTLAGVVVAFGIATLILWIVGAVG